MQQLTGMSHNYYQLTSNPISAVCPVPAEVRSVRLHVTVRWVTHRLHLLVKQTSCTG